MSIVYLYKCEGLGCETAAPSPGADHTRLPEGWRAFSFENMAMHACSVKCAVSAIEKKLLALFKREIVR